MKKLLAFAFTAICVMLSCIAFTSCKDTTCYEPESGDTACYLSLGDTLAVEHIAYESIFNPGFPSAADLEEYAEAVRINRIADSILSIASPEVLSTIYYTLQEGNIPITKRTVMEEYLKHQSIYRNIKTLKSYRALELNIEDSDGPCEESSGCDISEKDENQLREGKSDE